MGECVSPRAASGSWSWTGTDKRGRACKSCGILDASEPTKTGPETSGSSSSYYTPALGAGIALTCSAAKGIRCWV